MPKNKFETIIIGAGMSGLTAALYASRKRMDYKIIAPEFGGQFDISGEILNYPGLVKTTGLELKSNMKKQMEINQVEVTEERVEKIEREDKDFSIITDKNKYDCQSVIIATGSKPRKLEVPGEEKFSKKGVTYCAICDGPLFSDMEVALVGGGSSAMEAADFLKDICKKIYMLVLDNKLTGHEYLQENIKNIPNLEIIYNAKTTDILGDKLVSGIKYEKNGKENKLDVRGVVIEIGRIPNVEPFKGLVKLDEHNHIKVDCQMQTNIQGIFAAGDVASGHEYQYVISAGQGCMALLKVARYLTRKK